MLNEEKKNRKEKKVDPEMRRAKKRILIAAFFLILGAGSLTYGVIKMIYKDPGWREINAEAKNHSCANDFSFMYNIGYNGASASLEYNKLKELYTDAMVKSYRIFNNSKTFSGVNNVRYINEHPDEEIKVDKVLYHAFEQLEENGIRNLYLGSVSSVYEQIFMAESDEEAYAYDPFVNEAVKAKYEKLATYARDKECKSGAFGR